MYSGTTFTKFSGRLLGAHQKIDRISRRNLNKLLPNKLFFPSINNILQFEGKNGPDGLKRKSPSRNEPWHYYSPFNKDDSEIIELINAHYKRLVVELRGHNAERAGFEAAWLAHALVDGLTPAHHYPYEQKLADIRGGESKETRTSIKSKLVMPGSNTREKVKNNWKMWGPKGLISTHSFFEVGIASIFAPLSFNDSVPSLAECRTVTEIGIGEYFKRIAREIAILDIYSTYYQKGWTTKLAYDIRHKLGPSIVKTVSLAWYLASVEAEK